MKHNQTLRRGLGVLLALVMCLGLLPAALAAETGGVAIDATNFPDTNFCNYVSEKFDENKDGTLSADEIAAVTAIDCNNMGIESLKGIERFPALTRLECYENQLTELNVRSNTALKELDCYSNQLTELDVGSNTELEELYCDYNYLTELDVSSNPALKVLYCSYNGLTTLDVCSNTALEELDCSHNRLTELDVRSNTALTELKCHYNQLTTLDVSKNTALTTLVCYNNYLTSLDISDTYISETNNWEYLHIGEDRYDITLDENRAFDLGTLPGDFDIEKASGWKGGTVEAGILTFELGSDVVTYTYDCGKETSAAFTLDASTKYNVTAYGIYGGTSGITPGATYTTAYAAGGKTRLQIAARDGYKLKDLKLEGIEETDLTWTAGKFNENSQRAASFTMPDHDVIAVFIWEKDDNNTSNTKTITLNANGGYVACASVETGEDGRLSSLLTPTRDGYTFEGWFTENGTTAVTTETVFSQDTVLCARWTQDDVPPAAYTISFAPNGGTLSTGSHATTETDEYGTIDYFAAAAREDYTFDGWYTKKTGGKKVSNFTKFSGNTVLYAHWTLADETKQITEAAFGLKGYTAGANAEDIVVTSFTEGLSLPGGYLKAKDIPFSYVLVKADNLEEPASGPLEEGKVYCLWIKADVGAGYDSGLTKVALESITLNGIPATDVARDFDETVGLEFVLPPVPNSGAAAFTAAVVDSYAPATGAGEYKAGETVTLAAGSRDGYTFSGWTVVSGDVTLADESSAITTFTMPASAVTVQANWTKNGGNDTPAAYATSVTSSGGGAISVAATGLDANTQATIVVAQYSGGKQVDVRTETITGDASRAFSFTDSQGVSYKVFLLSSGSAPLCGAKSLSLG